MRHRVELNACKGDAFAVEVIVSYRRRNRELERNFLSVGISKIVKMNLQKTIFLSRQIGTLVRRNIGMSAVVFNQAQQMDPVQKLFYDNVVSYANQSKKLGGGPVDAGAEYQKLKAETEARLKKVYGVTDPKAFPEMKYNEPDLDQDSIEDF